MENRLGRAIADIAGFRDRRKLDRRKEELKPKVTTLDDDAIVFQSIGAAAASSGPELFPRLSEEWIRRVADPVCYQESAYYVQQSRVTVMEVGDRRILSSVSGSFPYVQEIVARSDDFVARCSCQAARINGSSSGVVRVAPLTQYLCRHSTAALRTCLALQEARPLAGTETDCVCPVTRKKLSGGPIFQCSVCDLAFSPEGWKFLQDTDQGKCCGCRSKNTIEPVNSSQPQT